MRYDRRLLWVVLTGVAVSWVLPVWAAESQEPPALPVPERVSLSLYTRLGEMEGIEKVVDDFVGRAMADSKVNFTRQGKQRTWVADTESVAKLKKHLAQFISMATGGPGEYQGRGMQEAHQGLEITDKEFSALIEDLRTSLKKAGVGPQEQEELLSVAESTRGAIVQSKDS